jgi:hypothetical protein
MDAFGTTSVADVADVTWSLPRCCCPLSFRNFAAASMMLLFGGHCYHTTTVVYAFCSGIENLLARSGDFSTYDDPVMIQTHIEKRENENPFPGHSIVSFFMYVNTYELYYSYTL